MTTVDKDLFDASDIDQRLPKTSQIYELLRSAIVSCRLQPGEMINEKDLTRQFEVSRTPLREAILQLAAQKLITIKSSSGTYVSQIRLNEVLEGQIVRDALETRTIGLAAKLCTPEFAGKFDVNLYRQRQAAEAKETDQFYALDEGFHRLICECAGFPNMWDLLNRAKGQLDRVRRLAFPVQEHLHEVVEEHAALIDAVKKRDADEAVRLMRSHVDAIETIELLVARKRDMFGGDVAGELQRFKEVLRATQAMDRPVAKARAPGKSQRIAA